VNRDELIASLEDIRRLASACIRSLNNDRGATVKASPGPNHRPARGQESSAPDFGQPVRHFMSTHARGRNGQQRFALLVAYFSKGNPDTEIDLQTIKNAWTRMQSLLGKFNTGYAVWAKDNGWVDSPKSKVYVVTPKWIEILRSDA